jgi:hypothetical protein
MVTVGTSIALVFAWAADCVAEASVFTLLSGREITASDVMRVSLSGNLGFRSAGLPPPNRVRRL